MNNSKYCFLLLLLSLPAIAAPPYSGTVFIDSNILTADDPSTFIQAVANGSGSRQMYDRRANNGLGDWVVVNALLFNAYFTDASTVEIQVNPEFEASEAADKANFYGHAIGQLPGVTRTDVQSVWIHKGDQAFGGGNNNILIHTDSPGYHGEWLEETLFHEACHTSLDSRLANSADWLNAQTLDTDFISTYARDNPQREDVAESCLPYFAMKNRSDRISASTLTTFESTIPNRALVLDSLNMKPIVQSDRYSYFDESTQLLQFPAVKVGDAYYKLSLQLADLASLTFSVDAASLTESPSFDLSTQFANNILDVPLLVAAGKRYAVSLILSSSEPIRFQITSAVEISN